MAQNGSGQKQRAVHAHADLARALDAVEHKPEQYPDLYKHHVADVNDVSYQVVRVEVGVHAYIGAPGSQVANHSARTRPEVLEWILCIDTALYGMALRVQSSFVSLGIENRYWFRCTVKGVRKTATMALHRIPHQLTCSCFRGVRDKVQYAPTSWQLTAKVYVAVFALCLSFSMLQQVLDVPTALFYQDPGEGIKYAVVASSIVTVTCMHLTQKTIVVISSLLFVIVGLTSTQCIGRIGAHGPLCSI